MKKPDFDKLQEKGEVEKLIKILHKSKESLWRGYAADALQSMKDQQSVMPLINLLDTIDTKGRMLVVRTLGKLEDSRAVAPLIKTLGDNNNNNNNVRREAANALGEIKDPRAVDPLINALCNEDEIFRNSIEKAIENIGIKVETLINLLKYQNNYVQKYAAEALGKIKDPQAVDPLINALGDIGNSVAKASGTALSRIVDVLNSIEKALENIGIKVETLINLLKNQNIYVRKYATEALGKIKDPRAVEPLINALVDGDKYIQKHAAEALGKIKDPRAVEPLINAYVDGDLDVQNSIEKAIENIGIKVETLLNLRNDQNSYIRKFAVVNLGKSNDPRAVEPLFWSLNDNESVKWAAAEALKILKNSLSEFGNIFQEKNFGDFINSQICRNSKIDTRFRVQVIQQFKYLYNKLPNLKHSDTHRDKASTSCTNHSDKHYHSYEIEENLDF